MPQGRVVAVEGASAAGKTTLVSRLAPLAGWTGLPEAWVLIAPRPDLDFHSERELLRLELKLLEEEARRYRVARESAKRGATVLADTGFLGPLTYTAGLVALGRAPKAVAKILASETRRLAADGRWGLPDGILYLDVGRKERDRRAALDPAGHPEGLYARHARVGELERALWRGPLGRALDGRVRVLRAAGPREELDLRVAREVVGAWPAPANGKTLRLAIHAVTRFPADVRRGTEPA